jgi:hypothetical protein
VYGLFRCRCFYVTSKTPFLDDLDVDAFTKPIFLLDLTNFEDMHETHTHTMNSLKGVPCVRLPNSCTCICPKKLFINLFLFFSYCLQTCSVNKLIYFFLARFEASPSHVLKCCARHERAVIGRYILFGSFISLARSLVLDFFIYHVLSFLCKEESDNDNYYCNKSHRNNIIGINVYPH